MAEHTCEPCHQSTDKKKKEKIFSTFSLADTSDTAQLSIFIRGKTFRIKSLHGTTTGRDIFEEVSKCINEMRLLWDKVVGLTIDGAPAMCDQEWIGG